MTQGVKQEENLAEILEGSNEPPLRKSQSLAAQLQQHNGETSLPSGH